MKRAFGVILGLAAMVLADAMKELVVTAALFLVAAVIGRAFVAALAREAAHE